ncbi:MAG: hypothetical protein EZS28_047583, partial [Streblomastix strix]
MVTTTQPVKHLNSVNKQLECAKRAQFSTVEGLYHVINSNSSRFECYVQRCCNDLQYIIPFTEQSRENYYHFLKDPFRLTSNLENLDSNKMCLDDILGIRRHYSNICTAATSLYFLNHINIFGRDWHPELLVEVILEVQEQKIESEQQITNENKLKRRRIDNEQDIIQHPHELPKSLEEGDEQPQSQQEDDEQTQSQQEDDEQTQSQQEENEQPQSYETKKEQPQSQQENDEQTQSQQEENEQPQSYETKKEHQNITDKFRERIVQIVNEKFDNLNKSQFLTSTNQQHEPNNIPQIDASPLSQPFSQECVQLPFYNACRQDELQEVVQKIFQLSDQGEEQKKRRKLDESVKAFVQYHLFFDKGNCTYGEKYAQESSQEKEQDPNPTSG